MKWDYITQIFLIAAAATVISLFINTCAKITTLEIARDINRKLGELTGNRYWDSWIDRSRSHPLVVKVVEELGSNASGRFAELKVVEIPDGVKWQIQEYDGNEHVAQAHRTWR